MTKLLLTSSHKLLNFAPNDYYNKINMADPYFDHNDRTWIHSEIDKILDGKLWVPMLVHLNMNFNTLIVIMP